MKEETLKKFREEYTTYLEAADSNFAEIERLEKEFENDPRVIQIKKLQEEISNDPKTKRLEELKKIKKDLERQKEEYGYWGYSNSDYAYFTTKPVINEEDAYGVLVRFGPRKLKNLFINVESHTKDGIVTHPISGDTFSIDDLESTAYTYLEIETFCSHYIVLERDVEEFEKNHKVIHAPSESCEEKIRKEFIIGCALTSQEESAKQLMKKYNNTKEEE